MAICIRKPTRIVTSSLCKYGTIQFCPKNAVLLSGTVSKCLEKAKEEAETCVYHVNMEYSSRTRLNKQ